jgi:hypothetical protein
VDQAVTITQEHIARFVNSSLSSDASISVRNVTVSQLGVSIDLSSAEIGLEVEVVFQGDMEPYPNQTDIDQLVEASLVEPNVQALSDELSLLSPTNPFSAPTSVSYSTVDVPADLAEESLVPDSNLIPFVSSMLGTFALLTVGMVAFNSFKKKRRGRIQRDFHNTVSYAGKQKLDLMSEWTRDCDSDTSRTTVADSDEVEPRPLVYAIGSCTSEPCDDASAILSSILDDPADEFDGNHDSDEVATWLCTVSNPTPSISETLSYQR